MPFCPALKQYLDPNFLRQRDEAFCRESVVDDEQHQNLPKSVSLELVPKTFGDKAYVTSTAKQNPQIRFNLGLNQPLAEVFSWLRHKWLPDDQRQSLVNAGKADDEIDLPCITIYPSAQITLRSVVVSRAKTNKQLKSCSAIDLPSYNVGLIQCVGQSGSTSQKTKGKSFNNQSEQEPVSSDILSAEHIDQMKVSSQSKCANAVKVDGPSVVLDGSSIANGLSSENCQGLTVGQLCLMCSRASTLRFTYSIKCQALAQETVSPVWKCFLKLIQRDFFDLLDDKVSDKQETSAQAKLTGKKPENEVPQSSPSNGIKISGLNKRITNTQEEYFQKPIPVPIVANENQAFLLQYQQIRQNTVVKGGQLNKVQSTSGIKRPLGISSPVIQSVAKQHTSNKTTMFTPVINPNTTQHKISIAKPMVNHNTGSVEHHSQKQNINFSKVSNQNFANHNTFIAGNNFPTENVFSVNNALPQNGHDTSIYLKNRQTFIEPCTPKDATTSQGMDYATLQPVTNFQSDSNCSLLSFLANTPEKQRNNTNDNHQAEKLTLMKNFAFDFSLDSVKNGGNSLMGGMSTSSVDLNLHNDVRRSVQLMNEQDSVEFCQNFAQLADSLVLDTPKKSNHGKNGGYFK